MDLEISTLLPILLKMFLYASPLLLLGIYFTTNCPSCYKFLARRFSGRKDIGEKTEVHSESQNTGRKDANGETIYVNVKVPYIRSYFRSFWVCRWCGHEGYTDCSESRRA